MNRRRLAIGGGVFDPIHIGHLVLFNECTDLLQLDAVYIIPTYSAVHKEIQEMSSYEHRREMVRMICERNERFHLCEIEKELGGKSYTIETIRALKSREEAEWFFIVGRDNLKKMEEWYRPEEIVSEITVVVGTRPESIVSEGCRFANSVRYLDTPSIEVSSTDIRERVKAGKSIKYLVPDYIEAYIVENELYLK